MLQGEGCRTMTKHYGGVMKEGLSFLVAIMTLLALSGYGNTAEIDTVLSNARKEGKLVMLEVGSVGCVLCEKRNG